MQQSHHDIRLPTGEVGDIVTSSSVRTYVRTYIHVHVHVRTYIRTYVRTYVHEFALGSIALLGVEISKQRSLARRSVLFEHSYVEC